MTKAKEKQRPKCEVNYICAGYYGTPCKKSECDIVLCPACTDDFTPAEKITALRTALKELGIDVNALQSELTYVKGEYAELSEILHNKPKEVAR